MWETQCHKPTVRGLVYRTHLINFWGSFMSLGFPHYDLFSGEVHVYIYVYHVIWIKKQRSLDNLWNTNEDKKQLKW